MPSPIETQRTSSPENALLDELKSTLASRWQEFDNQKNRNADHAKIKITYDGLVTDLQNVKTDNDLKNNQNIKIKIDAFLTQIDLSSTITKTSNKLTKLRDSIYIQQSVRTESGKLQQEVATNKLASTPDKKQESLPTTTQVAAVAAVGGTGAFAAIESGGKKAEEAVKGIMKPLEKIKKWSSDIGNAWDAGWELVKKGDISKGIGLFFAVLFGGNLKDALAKYAGKKDEAKPADKKEDSAHPENSPKYSTYYASITVFRSMNKEIREKYSSDIIGKGDEIMGTEAFMNMNFNMVGSMIQRDMNKNGTIIKDSLLHRYIDKNLLKPLGYSQDQATYRSVGCALQTIYYKGEGFLGKHIGSEFQKVDKNKTIREATESLADELSFAHYLDSFDANNLADGVRSYIQINPSTGEASGIGGETLKKSFSKETLIAFIRKPTVSVPNSLDKNAFENDKTWSGANFEEAQKLIRFRSDFISTITTTPSLTFGNSEIIQSLKASSANLSYVHVLELYALFGGEGHFSKMSSARRAALYPCVMNLLDEDSTSQVGSGSYKWALIKQVSSSIMGSDSVIPGDMLEFMKEAGKKVAKGVGEAVLGGAQEYWGALKNDPAKIIVLTLIIAFIVSRLPIFPAKGRTIGQYLLPTSLIGTSK